MFNEPPELAPNEVDARDREHEYQRDEPGQAGARQILADVELAKVLLQASEAQAMKPRLSCSAYGEP